MDWWQAIILGIIEGVTEFLPISSTGHLTITEKLMGMDLHDPSITAFTAIIQIGAIAASIIYFWQDIWQIIVGWCGGLFNKKLRHQFTYKYGWAIIIGSIPIAIIGLTFKDQIETTLRSLWFVATGLIVWSGVMWLSDKYSKTKRQETEATAKDTFLIGLAQCIALIPGISRSGATISAGLIRGFDRLTVTKISFFLGIPALVAAGFLQVVTEYHNIATGVGWLNTAIGIIVSFVVGYFSIAWLLKFISHNDFSVFIAYRVATGFVIISLLATGIIQAT